MVTRDSGAGTRFFGQTSQTARLMLYGLLAVVLMAMDQRGHYVPRARVMAGHLIEPVYHVVDWPVTALRNLFGQLQSRRSLRHENARLKKRLLAQQGDLQRLDTLQQENRRLRALFTGAQTQPFDYQYAELLRVDLDPFSHKVMVDRGSVHGVEIGQAVIDGTGVMGQVEEVHSHYSTIRLISDPNHALPVQINRTGLRTVAFGLGETGSLSLPSMPHQADVREGDLVVTSGLGERFPGGYPVARVTSVERPHGGTFARVWARPLATLGRGREVLLIRSPEAGEAAAAETGFVASDGAVQPDPDAGSPAMGEAGEAGESADASGDDSLPGGPAAEDDDP
ncbi:MAG: rod shape-determining protein MreC [Xanthomonadales bacterium]|nr:rod shape-determining protein MreC [Xanthomonadales bacterium]